MLKHLKNQMDALQSRCFNQLGHLRVHSYRKVANLFLAPLYMLINHLKIFQKEIPNH